VSLDDRLRRQLDRLRARGLERRLPRIEAREGTHYRLDGRPVVGFCGNDYLGLASDPILRTDLPETDNGASASRLICGDLPLHREVEARLAAFAGTQDAVLFPSGFQLNVGVLPALLQADDRVDSDVLNHASLIDGLRLARARPRILPHTQPPPTVETPAGLHWWITETIFSMDGDSIDPAAVSAHVDGGGCAYVDEAHAVGLFDSGRGLLAQHAAHPTVLVGTLSKAFGCAGAFVASSAIACTFIRTRARSFVFSTGIAPAVVARIDRALDVVTGEEGDRRRADLWSNARRFAELLAVPAPQSPIFPVLVGDNDTAVAIATALVEAGYHVQAIRPPTVPTGTARLRVTITAAHTFEEIEAFAASLREVLERHDLPLLVERGRAVPLQLQ
jgi:7-keto-8-aminopelargonate synthetase-like enzyme